MKQAEIWCLEKHGHCLGQGHGVWMWAISLASLKPHLQNADENKNDHLTGLLPGVMRWHMWKHFEK